MSEHLASHDYRSPRHKETSSDKVQDTLRTLEEGIDRLLDSESFAAYLQALSRFHAYSFGNVALLMAQRPDATRVAGYRVWQSLGRQVRKGERGIKILVPHKVRVVDAEQEEGTPAYRLVGYGVGTVFDISQTDGEELPQPPAGQILERESDGGRALYRSLSDYAIGRGVPSVTRQAQAQVGRGNGYYTPATRAIVVSGALRSDAAAKTLAHEVAHFTANHSLRDLQQDVETVAESSAFVVLNHFGIDTSAYSFPYVVRWARDREVLRRNLAAVQETAHTIIEGVEAVLATPPQTGLVVSRTRRLADWPPLT